ncbi:Tetratricopeptide repeat protein 8 [Chytriomyces hyalinus]|nr:Tetratricopeptide repeat protein 8 [Chytriomyces hyalinus]
MNTALQLLSHAQYRDCIEQCDKLLEINPSNQKAWLLKIRATTLQSCSLHPDIYEHELCEPPNAISVPLSAGQVRPGTSLRASSQAGRTSIVPNQSSHAAIDRSRLQTGYIRPMTAVSARTATSSGKPQTSAGAGPGTTSFMQQNSEGQLINVDGIDFKRLAQKPALSRAVFEYLFNSLGSTSKALELALAASSVANNKDWWWKLQISKCCLRLGDWREAKKQIENSLSDQEMLLSRLYLAKVYLQMDQPQKALKCYTVTEQLHPKTSAPLLAKARVCEELMDYEAASSMYKSILESDSSNIEALSALAASCFLNHQPEIAERHYRRLLYINGTETCEIWNNIGLCSFYSQQYDSSLPCFERALELSQTDTDTADVWYNIAHVGISVGDFELARSALKLTLSFNAKHGEAWNNLGILDILECGNKVLARSHFRTCVESCPRVSEASFNLAKMDYLAGDVEGAYRNAVVAKKARPSNARAVRLFDQLSEMLL